MHLTDSEEMMPQAFSIETHVDHYHSFSFILALIEQLARQYRYISTISGGDMRLKSFKLKFSLDFRKEWQIKENIEPKFCCELRPEKLSECIMYIRNSNQKHRLGNPFLRACFRSAIFEKISHLHEPSNSIESFDDQSI